MGAGAERRAQRELCLSQGSHLESQTSLNTNAAGSGPLTLSHAVQADVCSDVGGMDVMTTFLFFLKKTQRAVI